MRRTILAFLAACTMMASPLPAFSAKNEAAVKKGAVKPAAKKTAGKKQAVKPATKSAKSSAGKKKTANRTTTKKKVAQKSANPLRHVAVSDDPAHLAIQSSAALVLDQTTGKALVEKQPDAVLPIASISKLMTAMVVLDAGLDLNEIISISHDDIDDLKGTRSRLPVGTTMTRETAMLLALMSSENRAANALGRHYPGGLPAFVAAMNRKARSLGMFDSRFEEPTGLSSNNVSTAHDLARMVTAAARYPEIRMFSTTAEAKVELNGRIQNFGNTNALVRSENWQIGVSKTGYISEAGRCLVMQAWVADKPVVIVLLDSQGKMTRVGDANRIKRWMESASLTKGARPV
ncbi:MAG TPA: D-alanyl-D-alanine endopeptidase [Rhodocyclaceae bacterium]|nr:D-alanyl-D-alanine endopeptidase [Rhodocyclaceae bacterium]